MSSHKCHKLHDMIPSPMALQPQICFVCTSHFMPSYQTLTCQECSQSLCLECVLLYTPETAFPMHLANYGETASLRCYTTNKECATKLLRDPYMATVYHEFQRFYNTDEYIQHLEDRVTNTKHEIECIKMELQNTQNRLSSAKLELLNARHRKRLNETNAAHASIEC
jgi:hypothetical protein